MLQVPDVVDVEQEFSEVAEEEGEDEEDEDPGQLGLPSAAGHRSILLKWKGKKTS